MKTLPSLFVVIAFAATSMAAIEFSEDQAPVAAVDEVVTASEATGSSTASDQTQAAAMAAVSRAQSTGAAGPFVPMRGLGGSMMGIVGGGRRGINAVPAALQDGVADNAGDKNGSESNAVAAAADDGSGSNAVPEPVTAVVWSILALCGIATIRIFGR